jgi:hypothetical protein
MCKRKDMKTATLASLLLTFNIQQTQWISMDRGTICGEGFVQDMLSLWRGNKMKKMRVLAKANV